MSGLFLKNVLVAAAVCCSVLVTVALGSLLGSPVLAQEPIRCAPCAPEKLSECPVVAHGCVEVLSEPGCGCCLVCALMTGELCGIYTAPCGYGLRCTPIPGDLQPLQSLIRSQAVCMASPIPQNPDRGEVNATEVSGPCFTRDPPGHNKSFDPPSTADAQESMKAKVSAIRKKLAKQAPCQLELQRALEKIAKSQQKLGDKLARFYLPNCDKHGLFKAKQCESSLDGQRGRCWCVSSWNGKKIPGSTDLSGDADCS
ncbi:insulin-like growth factor-binding protein 1 isoform X1 [Salvelinus fontinalis]|uniref:insulin-like growth factor-binding protein 1 isoform X1 n=1 Tax=Salvelinus fontinalis TaxID=8038 RepID=UPI002485275C|nr:insulin-like growth factor-binding protein 1 isoform X1 [Salvelinus fontinalis]